MLSLLRLSKFLSAAAGISILAAGQGAAILPEHIQIANPTFEPLYDGTVIFTADPIGNLMPSPYGLRGIVGILGGNITNATTGELEGQVLPMGGQFGIFSNTTGHLYPEATIIIQWEDDKTHALFSKVAGVADVSGQFMSTTESINIETGSTTRQFLVENMCIFSIIVTPVNDPSANVTIGTFRMFGKTSNNPLSLLNSTSSR